MRLITANLERAIPHGKDLEARPRLALADTRAGLCIAYAEVTFSHGIGMTISGACPRVIAARSRDQPGYKNNPWIASHDDILGMLEREAWGVDLRPGNIHYLGRWRRFNPMTVGLRVKGELREHFGAETIQISLADGATLADLLASVGERWGGALPAHLWDAAAGRFRGPVVLMSDKTAVRDPQTRLRDGQEISLFKVLVGG